MGLGAATAPTMASYKSMIRLSATVDSDVYLKTAMADFDKNSVKMLPVGMVCPSCGDREVNKVKNNSFCHACGNYSKTMVKTSKVDPSKLDVVITWID
jgi:Zn finger protein HypA/HybF involved in hydrogenase expression